MEMSGIMELFHDEPQDLTMSAAQKEAASRNAGILRDVPSGQRERARNDSSDVGPDWGTNELICTELLTAETLFQSNKDDQGQSSASKTKSASRRILKVKSSLATSPLPSSKTQDHERRPRATLGERKRSNRSRKTADNDASSSEITVLDEMSVAPLDQITGDLDFEDLEPEDLELIRNLPPPGNVKIGAHCVETLNKFQQFQRRLKSILNNESKSELENGADLDSDATLSIASDDVDEESQPKHSATHPTTDISVLKNYNKIFDPPVPAVVTIPTTLIRLRSKDDWETESKAVQYLLNRNKKDRTLQNRNLNRNKQRRGESMKKAATKAEPTKELLRLITAIEMKCNQVVHLKAPIFSLQYPPDYMSKPKSTRKEAENGLKKTLKAPMTENRSRLSSLLDQMHLEPFCRGFIDEAVAQGYPLEEETLEKALGRKRKLEKLWKTKVAFKDSDVKADFQTTISDVQKYMKMLKLRKERLVAVAEEKFIMDRDEIDKRFQSNSEKAKSHVINMFEENRRQYELQRTLDFATCKCDVLSINTRNMRRRDMTQPHSRNPEDNQPSTSSHSQTHPNSSPNPHSTAAPPAPVVPNNQRRRRVNFNTALKETLDDREIYDDLNTVNRMVKEDQMRARQTVKTANVVVENDRLVVDGRVFVKNQVISFEQTEMGRYTGKIINFSRTEIIIKRLSDGSRSKYPLGHLMDKRLVIRKRAVAAKKANGVNGLK